MEIYGNLLKQHGFRECEPTEYYNLVYEKDGYLIEYTDIDECWYLEYNDNTYEVSSIEDIKEILNGNI